MVEEFYNRGKPPKSGLSTLEWIIIAVIVIIALFLIGWTIWYFFFAKKGAAEGEKCDKSDDCDAGLYCGGDNLCHKGTHGGSEGTKCTTSSECDVGFACIKEACTMRTNGINGT